MSEAAPSAPCPPLSTKITSLFGIRYPIIQTGMGWVADPALTAATSNAGGMGILAAATLSLDELQQALNQVRERTQCPFGVNLRADHPDANKAVALIVESGAKVASFAGPPRKDLIEAFRDGGLLTLPTVGATRHAKKMADWGVDALIAQGHEGGGHTGAVPTSILLPSVCAAVDIPVLGAGGFNDGRGLVAALAFGASGIAMGTRFLLTRESPVPDEIKAAYLEAGVTDTIVTEKIDGYPQRVIRTSFVDRLEKASPIRRWIDAFFNIFAFQRLSGLNIGDMLSGAQRIRQEKEMSFAQLIMAANAPMLTRASMVDGRMDAGILPTGQITGTIATLPTVEELISEIMREAGISMTRLGAMQGGKS